MFPHFQHGEACHYRGSNVMWLLVIKDDSVSAFSWDVHSWHSALWCGGSPRSHEEVLLAALSGLDSQHQPPDIWRRLMSHPQPLVTPAKVLTLWSREELSLVDPSWISTCRVCEHDKVIVFLHHLVWSVFLCSNSHETGIREEGEDMEIIKEKLGFSLSEKLEEIHR